jgi:hypothetical protein
MVLRFIRWRRLGHLLIAHGHTGLERLRDAPGRTCPTVSRRKACPVAAATRHETSDDSLMLATKLPRPEPRNDAVTREVCWGPAGALGPAILPPPTERDLPVSVL